jgi:hypothetical protein
MYVRLGCKSQTMAIEMFIIIIARCEPTTPALNSTPVLHQNGNQVSKRQVARCPALVKWLVYQSQDERVVEVPTYFDHGGA